jgi:site-specific DNA recombinase
MCGQRSAGTSIHPSATNSAIRVAIVPGPLGGRWSPSTIYGSTSRGTGILNNELYVGRLVWNRLRYIKDPDSGRRVSRLNARSEWVLKDVPELRIVTDELWNDAKRRQEDARRTLSSATSIVKVRRPQYLFSGLTKCGICGSGFVLKSRGQLSCFGATDRGFCTNHLRIARQEVEARVLHALREKLLRRDLFEEFCQEFTREMNRLRMAQSAGTTAAESELRRVETQIGKLIQAIKDGVSGTVVKAELLALDAQREQLRARLAQAEAPMPLLHPNMADLYREKVMRLEKALTHEDSRAGATEVLRGLLDAIVLTPTADGLQIELQGNLAAMLRAAKAQKGDGHVPPFAGLLGTTPSTDEDEVVRILMVAGGGFEPPTFGL